MKYLGDVNLTFNQQKALNELRKKLTSEFNIDSMYLYGSIVRNEAGPESDIDILILTKTPLDRSSRHQITDRIFEINLEFNTNFSSLVLDRNSWETGPISVLPIHSEIFNEGVVL